jgi:hypothetical protein
VAVTQIHSISTTLGRAIDYIINPAKTDGKMLISGFNCTPEMAAYEFEYTKKAADRQGGVLAHHIIQSFAPGEVSCELAHEIGKRLADKHLNGKYEYVLATHINCGHIHNHIIFNSVPVTLEAKYHSNTKSYMAIRKLSDELCGEHRLSAVEPRNEKAKTYKEYNADKRGVSWKSKLRGTIDRCIMKARDWEEFLALMEKEQYEVKRGKHISFRAKGQERFTRSKTLGERYSETKIKASLSGTVKVVPKSETEREGISLLIDIENNVKAGQSAGYRHWVNINNLKMAAMTINYLSDNGLLDYKTLSAKHDELRNRRNASLSRIKEVERRIKEINEQIRDIDAYRKNKPVVEKLDGTLFKEKYKREHESEFILFNAAKQAVKNHFPDGKLPLIKTLRAEANDLYSEKNKLYEEYYSVKDEFKTLSTMKRNVDSILGQSPDYDKGREEREKQEKRDKEKGNDGLE